MLSRIGPQDLEEFDTCYKDRLMDDIATWLALYILVATKIGSATFKVCFLAVPKHKDQINERDRGETRFVYCY